jgi:2-succinyl-5-enolpyruvyl-6-hydroxy-3-cyclohexene-1-carboxylate synthase
MPVRDLDAFAGRGPERIFCNRGLNGIDGFTSTLVGVAAALAPAPVTGLCGDLTFLHDAAGLFGLAHRSDVDVTLVVVDNDGGGIFSFLPQATSVEESRFETLFGTPHGLELTAVAAAFGLPAVRVETPAELQAALDDIRQPNAGVRIVVAATGDRAANVAWHRRAWAAVADALA